MTGIIGVAGLRAFFGRGRKRGVIRLDVGGAFLAATVAQRRSRKEPVEATYVIDAGPEVETTADATGGVGDHTTGQTVADVTPDPRDYVSEFEEDTTSRIDRLREAALDRQSREVPVPQRAFNQGFWRTRPRRSGASTALTAVC